MAEPDKRLSRRKSGLPAKFKPEGALARQAQADAVIGYAKRIHDWPLLEKAVEQMIADQKEVLAWWDANVIDKGGRPRREE